MSKLDEAIAFLNEAIFEPVLTKGAPQELVSTIKHTRMWINHFKSLGDLEAYLLRFSRNSLHSKTAYRLKEAGFKTFEDITPAFLKQFGQENDRIFVDCLVIGGEYSSFDISIIAQTYDNRSGGILAVKTSGEQDAILLKTTIGGKKYKNEWLKTNELLKSYLQSKLGTISTKSSSNQLIIANPERPIFCFVRSREGVPFTFRGIFKNLEVCDDTDGEGKWFKLQRQPLLEAPALTTFDALQEEFAQKIAKAAASDATQRRKRLEKAPVKPVKRPVVYETFIRNADVVAEVLFQAGGRCQGCGERAPFQRKRDGTDYLEVHHKVPLAEGGDDTVANSVALCPNCHRREHHGLEPRWGRAL